MATYDSADLLARCQRLALRPSTDEETAAADWFALITEGQEVLMLRLGGMLLILVLCGSSALPAQQHPDIRWAAPIGIAADAGLQLVPGFRINPDGFTLRIAAVGLVAVATKKDAFEMLWGAVVSETLGHIWRLLHRTHDLSLHQT